MKKHWKVVVGAVLLIGGFGCIDSDMGAAVFGVLVGIALIVWWWLSWKKVSTRRPTTTEQSPRPVSRNHTVEKQDVQLHTESVVPPKEPQSPPLTTQPVTQVPPPSAKPKERYDVVIPEKKDGVPLAYRYSVHFVPSNLDAVLAAAKAERWYLSAKQIGKEIHLFSEEIDLGVLTERADMVSDWIKRGEPHLAVIERVNSETGCTILLVFYRDKQKYYANREQTVVALTGYKSDEKQNVILSLDIGTELEAEEDYEKEGRVLVSNMGEVIGSLPKKYAERFINEGATLIVFDHSEEDGDTFVSKPFVKIFW